MSDDQVREKICSKSTDEQTVLTAVNLMLIFTVISCQTVNSKWGCSLDWGCAKLQKWTQTNLDERFVYSQMSLEM